MALTIPKPNVIDRNAGKRSAERGERADLEAGSAGLSPTIIGFGVMAISIVLVLVLSMLMMLVLTDVSVLAAFGLGLYCAFWLGIGFGTIFGAAAVFGRDH